MQQLPDTRFMASLAAPLADGMRRVVLLWSAADDDAGTGLLVLAPDYSDATANAAARRWLDELGAGASGRLSVALRSVAVRAREIARGERADGTGAWARVRTPAGRWAVVQGSLPGDGPDAQVAVLMHTARPAELAPLIADAYGLTNRERRGVELEVRRGSGPRQCRSRRTRWRSCGRGQVTWPLLHRVRL